MRPVTRWTLPVLVMIVTSACASGRRWQVTVSPLATTEAAPQEIRGRGAVTPDRLAHGADVPVFRGAAPMVPHDTLAVVQWWYESAVERTCTGYEGGPNNLRCGQMGWRDWCPEACIVRKLQGAVMLVGGDALVLPAYPSWNITRQPREPAVEVRFNSYAIRCREPRCGR